MSTLPVTVVDYGIGNLFSVQRALETCGASVTMAADAVGIDAAQRLVLPGVGAFADGMQGLRDRGLIEPLRRFAASGRPLLGICLGMQMLATASEEFGEHEGLGIIPGRVKAIPLRAADGSRYKIPHIGWAGLQPGDGADWRDTPLGDTAPGTPVYLVHSFHVVPDQAGDLLAWCDYGGHRIGAAIGHGRVYGFQFHPEKSAGAGLAIVRQFLALQCR